MWGVVFTDCVVIFYPDITTVSAPSENCIAGEGREQSLDLLPCSQWQSIAQEHHLLLQAMQEERSKMATAR